MNLIVEQRWHRVCAGMYELGDTGYAIERRAWDRRWHCFHGEFALGYQAETLHEAKALVLDHWARERNDG